MASSSSLGNASLANASSAQAFYTHFRTSLSSLTENLANVSTKEGLQDALSKYAALSAELTKAVDSGILPAHDREVHKRGLKEVAAVLEERRKKTEGEGEGKKKVGFSFKRKQPTATSKTTSVATTQPKPTSEATSSNQRMQEPIAANHEPVVNMSSTAEGSSHLTISSLRNTSHKHTPSETTKTNLSIDLTDITNSLVDLRSLAPAASILSVQLRSVTSSIILLPPIDGSIMIHHLTSSLLTIPSCHQFRMHNSKDAAIELCTKRGSVLTVEACDGIRFVTGPEGVKVQDFDDLINSEQLKHGSGKGVEGKTGNFRVLSAEKSDLAAAIEKMTTEGTPIKDCIEEITHDVDSLA